MRARKSLVGISGTVTCLAAGTLVLGWATTAFAVAVKAVNAGSTVVSGTTTTVYFPLVARNIEASNPNCAGAQTYPTTLTALDATAATSFLDFDFTPVKTLSSIKGDTSTVNSGDISIRVEDASSSTGIALVAGDSGYSYNNNDGTRLNYGNTENRTARVQISLADLSSPSATGYCNFLKTKPGGSFNINNCQVAGGTTPATITLNVGLVNTLNTLFTDTNSDKATINVVLANCQPGQAATPPALSFSLTAGDERIKLTNAGIAPSDPLPLKSLLVFADRTGSSPSITAEVQREFLGSTESFESFIDGLSNEQSYCFSLGYVNAAGFISTVPNPITASRQCATPSQIDGFLNRSTCFIATAAYGTDLDPRLDTLRAFRDRILLKHSPGRAFVNWYYSWSPRAARWLWRKPAARAVVRAALVPVLGLAHVALWASAHHAALAATAAFTANAWASSEAFPISEESASTVSAPAQATGQRASKQSLKDPQFVQPYIESLKAGKTLEPKYKKTVNHVAGLSIVTSNSFHVTSDKLQANSFDAVYTPGDKYAIGVDLFYERQIFRHWLAGAIGPVFHLNLIALKGKGIFTKFGSTSDDTLFNFYAVPITAGLSYRFTLGRFIVPFVQYSLAAIPVMEMRDDGHPTRRAIATGDMMVFGVALNMDWLGRRSAWNQYQSSGILHTYLSLQRESLRTKTGPFAFDYDATYAGLTFEI